MVGRRWQVAGNREHRSARETGHAISEIFAVGRVLRIGGVRGGNGALRHLSGVRTGPDAAPHPPAWRCDGSGRDTGACGRREASAPRHPDECGGEARRGWRPDGSGGNEYSRCAGRAGGRADQPDFGRASGHAVCRYALHSSAGRARPVLRHPRPDFLDRGARRAWRERRSADRGSARGAGSGSCGDGALPDRSAAARLHSGEPTAARGLGDRGAGGAERVPRNRAGLYRARYVFDEARGVPRSAPQR